jgi:hypothetical protein
MVVVSVLLGRIEIGAEPVRDERYPLCGPPTETTGLVVNSLDTPPPRSHRCQL